MNKEEEQKKIWQSQGMKLSRPEIINIQPKNKIEEALKHLPQLSKHAPVEVPRTRISDVQENKRTWQFFVICLLLLFCIPAFAYGGILIYRHIRTPATTDSATLIAEVGKNIELPKDETPTIATITDLAPLAGEPFFKDAAVGDKVLIYSKAGEAVLYRPSTKKVVVVGPLSTAPQTPAK